MERHRLAAVVLELLRPHLAGGLVVEAAPTPAIQQLLLQFVSRDRYLSFDLGLDPRNIDIRADLTRLPFPDRSIETIVCSHVLEHIPDDAAAMRELARVIADEGIALVMNPWARGKETDEDPSAPEEERIRRFGQADHVRVYGRDFEDRLRAAGLHVHRFEPTLRLPTDLHGRANLGGTPLWVLTREGPEGDAIRATLNQLLPPGGPLPASVFASRVSPLMLAADTPSLLASLATAVAQLDGIRVLEDAGALEQTHRLVTSIRDDTGSRRDTATRLLIAADDALRITDQDVPAQRWAEALPGLTSGRGAALVEDCFDVLPDAQLVQAVAPGESMSAGGRSLRRVGMQAGVGRYLEIDPVADVDTLHGWLSGGLRV